MPQISALLRLGTETLQQTSPTARLDAELLLGFLLRLTRPQLLTHGTDNVADEVLPRYQALLERRRACEPVAYLIGQKEFWGLPLEVNPGVLIPRPETELLVERGWEILKPKEGPVNILDLGTGSGCIALALATELRRADRDFQVTASDCSETALYLAQKNCRSLGLEAVVKFIKSSFFQEFPRLEQFDLIVSNPPYIAPGDPEVGREISYEPKIALYANDQGLAAISQIVQEAADYLKVGGALLFEIGCTQAAAVRRIFASLTANKFSPVQVLKDLAGLDRVVEVQRVR